jgi:hypothetical protein
MCSESIAIFKEYNIAKHCNSKHKKKYKNSIGVLRIEKLAALKERFESQQKIFRRPSHDNSSALWASYRTAHLLNS